MEGKSDIQKLVDLLEQNEFHISRAENKKDWRDKKTIWLRVVCKEKTLTVKTVVDLLEENGFYVSSVGEEEAWRSGVIISLTISPKNEAA
jgi:hypothetical protein